MKKKKNEDDQDSATGKKARKLDDMEENEEEIKNNSKKKGKKPMKLDDMEKIKNNSKKKGKKPMKLDDMEEIENDSKKKGTNVKRRVCPICKKRFNSGQSLGGHLSSAHRSSKNEYDDDEDGNDEFEQVEEEMAGRNQENGISRVKKPVDDLARDAVRKGWLKKGSRGDYEIDHDVISGVNLLLSMYYSRRGARAVEEDGSRTFPRASKLVINQLKNKGKSRAILENVKKEELSSSSAHDDISPTSDSDDDGYWCNCSATLQASRVHEESINETVDRKVLPRVAAMGGNNAEKIVIKKEESSSSSSARGIRPSSVAVSAAPPPQSTAEKVEHRCPVCYRAFASRRAMVSHHRFHNKLKISISKSIDQEDIPPVAGMDNNSKGGSSSKGKRTYKQKSKAPEGPKKLKGEKVVPPPVSAMDNSNTNGGIQRSICDQGTSSEGTKDGGQGSKKPEGEKVVPPPVSAVDSSDTNGGIQRLICDQGTSSEGTKAGGQGSKKSEGEKVVPPPVSAVDSSDTNEGTQRLICDQRTSSEGRKDGGQGPKTPKGKKVVDFDLNQLAEDGGQGPKTPKGKKVVDFDLNQLPEDGGQGLKTPKGKKVVDFDLNQLPEESS